MNNQMNAAGAVPRQAPYDEAHDQLANEQARSDSFVTELYSRLNRALDPIGPCGATACDPVPDRAEICQSMYSALSVQRRLNEQLQDILIRLVL
jgi:hypothetical protein